SSAKTTLDAGASRPTSARCVGSSARRTAATNSSDANRNSDQAMTLPFGIPVGDTSSYNAPLHYGVPAALVPQFLPPLLSTRPNYLPQTAQVPFVAANNYPQTVQPAQHRGFEDVV